MNQLAFCLIACCLAASACQVNTSNGRHRVAAVPTDSMLHKEVVLQNNFTDTCFVFKDEAGDTISFNRNFEIVENSFGDTMNVGINFIPPGQKGKRFTIQIDTSSSETIFRDEEYKQYIEEQDLPELYTKWLCIYNLSLWHWGKTTRTGQMRIRVYYKPKKPVEANGH
jgi:hypothetical protein